MRIAIGLIAASLITSPVLARDGSSIPYPQCETKIACARNSVVSVLPLWPDNIRRSEEPEGSGVVVGDGDLIATANHVIGAAKEVLVRTISGQVLKVEIVLRNLQTDVALLRLPHMLKPVEFASSAPVGTRACAIGNSFGLDISVTCGVVSAVQMSGVGFNQIEDFIQTDATVNPGMSGGALVNENGRLIGMLSSIFTKQSDANIGVNFVVSAPLLQRILEEFSDTGDIELVRSGLIVKPAVNSGETGDTGALVVRVKEESPEAAAGIMAGDVILFADGRRIKRAGAYTAALARLRKGDSLALDILRNGKRETITIRFD